MNKTIFKLTLAGLLLSSTIAYSQTQNNTITNKSSLPKPYNEKEDGLERIQELIKQAKVENKNIILQVGGNWCIWCLRFNNFVQTTPELKNIVDQNFLYYHLNFSPKNKNDKVFAKYGDSGKNLGYPYFIILDKNGEKLHTQESSTFEEGKSYNEEKVRRFFESWFPAK